MSAVRWFRKPVRWFQALPRTGQAGVVIIILILLARA